MCWYIIGLELFIGLGKKKDKLIFGIIMIALNKIPSTNDELRQTISMPVREKCISTEGEII